MKTGCSKMKYPATGFTLIEILLVMLITSVLVLGVNAAFRQAHMLWSRAEKQRPVYQKSRLLFNALSEELLCLYIPTVAENTQPAPFSLTASSDGTAKLTFFTLNPAWEGSALSSLPARMSYEFMPDPDSGRWMIVKTRCLVSGEKTIGKEEQETILKGFRDMKIEVYDASEDSGSWKSQLDCRKVPPRAVKLRLTWPIDGQEPLELETVFNIATQGEIMSS